LQDGEPHPGGYETRPPLRAGPHPTHEPEASEDQGGDTEGHDDRPVPVPRLLEQLEPGVRVGLADPEGELVRGEGTACREAGYRGTDRPGVESHPGSVARNRYNRLVRYLAARRAQVLAVILCLVPVALWALAAPPAERFADATTALRSISVVCGLAGASAFAVNMIMGARLKAVDRLFHGLDKMYVFHRTAGKASFLLLLAHGLLMLASVATVSVGGMTDMLVPGTAGWTVPLGALALVGLTIVMFLTLYARLNHEEFVWAHRLMGVVFIVGALHVFKTPGTKAASVALTFYLAALMGAGVIAWLYRSVLGEDLVPRYDYRISAVNRLDDTVTELVMSPLDQRLNFIPGQFAFLEIESESMRESFHPVDVVQRGETTEVTVKTGAVARQAHPFSITSGVEARDLRVAIKAVGDFTNAVRAIDEGDSARIEGAYGSFSHTKINNHRQVWIAGGIGITPFLSMAESLGDESYEVDLYYALDEGDQREFLRRLEGLATTAPHLEVIPWFTRGTQGFLKADDIERRSGGLTGKDFLICGPPRMVRSLAEQLQNKGVPASRIHHEAFALAGK
jgi:predicted ferric reductase